MSCPVSTQLSHQGLSLADLLIVSVGPLTDLGSEGAVSYRSIVRPSRAD